VSELNAEWHRAHRMPERASRAARIAWHVEHREHCGCREVPASLAAEVEAAARAAKQKQARTKAAGRTR
jgi:hypothetical protein